MPNNFEGFVKIRRGLLEHFKQGKLAASDGGVYFYLLMECDYTTGTLYGDSKGIASGMGGMTSVDQIRHSLARLRKNKFINYPKGNGKRGSYLIILDKYEPTSGIHEGQRVNAWMYEDLVVAEYEDVNSETVVESELDQSGVKDESMTAHGRVTVASPIKDIIYKNKKEEVRNVINLEDVED
jgi:hypothetical protein